MPDHYEVPADYASSLPSSAEMAENLTSTIAYWSTRNKIIADMREMVIGKNSIPFPANTPYKIKVVHTYMLAAVINEKAARFLQQPQVQAIPGDIGPESRARSTELENALAAAFDEMELNGDGDVWSRLVLDAILLDEGVERIERAPAAFWPEAMDDEGNYIMEDEKFIDYKKDKGLPIRSVFVPLENWYPVYEGSTVVESYEFEMRSLRDVLRNKAFDTRAVASAVPQGSDKGLSTMVTVVHYVNSVYHAYYAVTPGTTGDWPNLQGGQRTNVGQPMLMKAYKHNLGRTLYNSVAGRFGGWKGNTNRIEGINKGLMGL